MPYCSKPDARSIHLIRNTGAVRGPAKSPRLFSIGVNSGRPCWSETAPIVAGPRQNRQPIMTREMEPSTLNVTLRLWGVAQCLACWRTCLEPRRANRDGKKGDRNRGGKLDGKTEEISTQAAVRTYARVSIDASMSCLLPSPKSLSGSNSQ